MSVTAVLHAPAPERDPDAWRSLWGPRVRKAAGSVSDEGALWVLAANAHLEGEIYPAPFALADEALAAGLAWKNVYVRYHEPTSVPGKPFAASHDHLLLFVRSLQRYHFDKDALREPHVFESLEWGRRTIGPTGYHDAARTSRRYPPGGRDPGNVLAGARRDALGRVLALDETPRGDALGRLVRATTRPGWRVLTNAHAKDLEGRLPDRRVEEVAW